MQKPIVDVTSHIKAVPATRFYIVCSLYGKYEVGIER